ATVVEQKRIEIAGADNTSRLDYLTAANKGSIDDALNLADLAPKELRDQLYQQIANRAVQAGDPDRARAIVNEHLEDPARRQALMNIDRQAIYTAASSKHFNDALRYLENFQPANQRRDLLNQIATQIGPGLKTSTAAMFLQQARMFLPASPRAEDDQSMRSLLILADAY